MEKREIRFREERPSFVCFEPREGRKEEEEDEEEGEEEEGRKKRRAERGQRRSRRNQKDGQRRLTESKAQREREGKGQCAGKRESYHGNR